MKMVQPFDFSVRVMGGGAVRASSDNHQSIEKHRSLSPGGRVSHEHAHGCKEPLQD